MISFTAAAATGNTMKPRIELNPKAIRHFRERLEWSQKRAAECLRKTRKQKDESLIAMYQRIERTGITSPRTAEKLAAHFTVSVKELQGCLPDDERFGLWWLEEHEIGQGTGILTTRIGMLNSLRDETALHELSWSKGEKVHAQVVIGPTWCSLTLPRHTWFSGDIPLKTWMIRPAQRTDAGVAFVRFTEYEREDITPIVKEIAFSVADTVSFNGVQTPPELATVGYLVNRYTHNVPSTLESHAQFYRTEADVLRYLVRQTKKQPHKRVNLEAATDCCSLCAVDAKWWFAVRRAYRVGENEVAQLAPWRQSSIKRFVNELYASFERAMEGIKYVGVNIHTRTLTPINPRTPLPDGYGHDTASPTR